MQCKLQNSHEYNQQAQCTLYFLTKGTVFLLLSIVSVYAYSRYAKLVLTKKYESEPINTHTHIALCFSNH